MDKCCENCGHADNTDTVLYCEKRNGRIVDEDMVCDEYEER